MLDILAVDLRNALRIFRRSPGFAATAVVSLAVGIAAATGLFSIVNAALLNPFPFADINRIVRLDMNDKGKPRGLSVTARQLVALQHSDVFDGWTASLATTRQAGVIARPHRKCVPLPLDLAGPTSERSLPDATHGDCHLLLALGPTIERLTAFAEVVQRCGDRIVFGYRPVDSVCLQPVVLSINRAAISRRRSRCCSRPLPCCC